MVSRFLLIMMALMALIGMVAIANAQPPEGFRGASAIPDEFFTCIDRAVGKYADDKRSCALFWHCLANGTLLHAKCPEDTPVFDDSVRDCVKSEPGKCPIDYGFWQSAQSFCRGRPLSVPVDAIHKQPAAQTYYPNHLNNCDSYYWCYIADGKSGGFEFKCPPGEKFDQKLLVCKDAKLVICKISHGADIVM